MATIVGAAGGGNWTTGATWVGGVAPTTADDVQLTSSSGAITINSGAVCRSLDCTGYTGTLTHTAAVTLNIGDGTAGASNIALKLVSGMTYTLGNSATSAIAFVSSSATQQTIDYSTKVPGSCTINGTGASYILSSVYNTGTGSGGDLSVLKGSFDTANFAITARHVIITSSSTRSVTLGSSVITLSTNGGGNIWDATTTTGLTFSAGTSNISCTGTNTSFVGGSLTYNTVSVIASGGGSIGVSGTNTFANLTMTATSSTEVQLSNNQTITTLLTMNAAASTFALIRSSQASVARTLTAAAVSINDCCLQDIAGAGAAAPFATTHTGDALGNSGITFPTGVTRYWVATTGGNFSATTSWSTTSGGSSGASVPLPQDTVVFDANSITSGSRTISLLIPCLPTLDFTNITNSPTIATGITNSTQYFFGNLKLISGLTLSGTSGLRFAGRSSYTITSAGKTFANPISIEAPGGTYTQADAFVSTSGFTNNGGTWDTGNFAFTVTTMVASNSNTKQYNWGTSTISLTGTPVGSILNLAQGSTTLNSSNATLVVANATNNARSITFPTSAVLGTLTYTVAGSTGSLTLNATMSIGTINFSDATNARTLTFTAGTTTTITGTFNVNGTSGKLMTVNSSSTTNAILVKTGGYVSVDYVTFTDITAQGNSWFAGANSVDGGGGVTGVTFTVPPVMTPAFMAFL